jgi:hypothetical protein
MPPLGEERRDRFIRFVDSLPNNSVLCSAAISSILFRAPARVLVAPRHPACPLALMARHPSPLPGRDHDTGRGCLPELGVVVPIHDIMLEAQGRESSGPRRLVMPRDYGSPCSRHLSNRPESTARTIHPDLLDAIAGASSHEPQALTVPQEKRARVMAHAWDHFLSGETTRFVMGHACTTAARDERRSRVQGSSATG